MDDSFAAMMIGGVDSPRTLHGPGSHQTKVIPEESVVKTLLTHPGRRRTMGGRTGTIVVILLVLASLVSRTVAGHEEFVGPFASWRDLKRDYHAVGDGRADDTDALQRALDDLVRHEAACVLYVPAGTYRLTRTVKTVREAHTDCQGVSLLGEDPANTVFRWDGAKGETMLRWDAWYSRIGRLTFDGAGRSATALLYGPAFSTYNQTSDIIFRDLEAGLVLGGPGTHGQAENAILRCQFLRCGTGLQTVNWNSMDIWVWYCRFEDCGRSIHNVMGNWHAWRNVFLRSRISDLSAVNLMAFSVVENTSIGSHCFFDFDSGHTWGSPVSLTGNLVLDPTGEWAVRLGNAGPYLLVDNTFRLSETTRGVRMTWADQTLIGNTYSRAGAVEERGRFRRIAERVVGREEIATTPPALPPPPRRRRRQVIEVPAGSGGDAIQRAIDRAAGLTGQRPVVHLPMGRYRVSRTIVIPSGSDLQLAGDGGAETATRLDWTGPSPGVVLRLEGPARATLRDFYVHAAGACGLIVEDADQERGRIFADQLNVNGATDQKNGRTAALRVRGLEGTDVLLRALQGSGHGGAWIDVVGGPAGLEARNQISVFTGATGSAAGQYDVRGGGRLVVRGVYHERSSSALTGLRLADCGELSIDATRFSYATSATSPTIAAIGFHGRFTLATCMLLPVGTQETCRFELSGDGSRASVLSLNNQFWVNQPGTSSRTVWVNRTTPRARGGLVGCNVNTSNKDAAPKGFAFLEEVGDHPDPARSGFGSGPLADHTGVDDATILRHLAPLREARVWSPGDPPTPTEVTDLRLHRIMVSTAGEAAVELRAARADGHEGGVGRRAPRAHQGGDGSDGTGRVPSRPEALPTAPSPQDGCQER